MTWTLERVGAEVHVLPLADSINHDDSDDCVCGPLTEAVPREDGSMGWLVTHHSLDGREQREVSDEQA